MNCPRCTTGTLRGCVPPELPADDRRQLLPSEGWRKCLNCQHVVHRSAPEAGVSPSPI